MLLRCHQFLGRPSSSLAARRRKNTAELTALGPPLAPPVELLESTEGPEEIQGTEESKEGVDERIFMTLQLASTSPSIIEHPFPRRITKCI